MGENSFGLGVNGHVIGYTGTADGVRAILPALLPRSVHFDVGGNMFRPLAYLTSISLIISGCAVPQTNFLENSSSMDDIGVCRNFISDQEKLSPEYKTDSQTENSYIKELQAQASRRGLYLDKCTIIVKEADDKIAAGVLLGILAVGAAATIKNSGGFRGGSSSYSGQYGHAWDQFYDGYGNLTWRCRNKSNGQFAYNSSCASSLKSDSTWPGK